MYIFDSNILIYASQNEYSFLRNLFGNNHHSVSLISYLEVVGYHKLLPDEKHFYAELFKLLIVESITTETIQIATNLRQQKKMSIGDSIIAATALQHNLILVTRNTIDFSWIENIKLQNPFTENV